MKKLILAIGLMLSLVTGFSQSYYTTNNLAAGSHTFVYTAHVANSMTFFSTNSVPTIVRLFDGALTYSYGVYTNYVTYLTNQITTYTNQGGTTNTFTNQVLYTALTAVAAATNNSLPLATYIVPADNGLVTVNDQLLFTRKMTLSNNQAGLSAVIKYRLP